MEIDQKVAERIINSKVVIEEASIPYKGIMVSYVGYTDSEGDPFLWNDEDGDPDPSRPYAIVSFKAMNTHQLQQSVEEYIAEEYDLCVNHNLSMRMDVDKAQDLVAGITIGTIICHEVEVEDEDGNLVMALLPKAYVPAKAKDAKKVSLADLLAKKSAPKAEEKVVKLNEAEEPVVAPKTTRKAVK